MKIINNIVNKCGGCDKILHFIIAFVLVNILSPLYNYIINIVCFGITLLLCYLKEKYWDETFNKQDLLFGILGACLGLLIDFIWILIFKLC